MEVFKAALSLGVGAGIALIGGLLVGHLTNKWQQSQQTRQKKYETDLNAVKSFYDLYGEFFAVWKLWNYELEAGKSNLPNQKWNLLDRAAVAEGKVEAILVKIASEKELTKAQIETLGMFRQAYQHLRQKIRDDAKLEWPHSEHPQYLEFKRRAAELAAVLADSNVDQSEQLRLITANKPWEDRWNSLLG
jgi:hypothetical protein